MLNPTSNSCWQLIRGSLGYFNAGVNISTWMRSNAMSIEYKISLDIHLGGWPLHFWPKWVINIIKLSMQIYSFWQNSRPQSPKTALFWAIIQIERAPFVSFYSISTQDKATFGQSEIRRDVFVHTATLQHSKGMLLKQDNLQMHYLGLQHYLSTWKQQCEIFVFIAITQLSKRRHL